MFTGLVEAVGKVVSLSREGQDARLLVDVGAAFDDVAVGESISISGACLTVVDIDGAHLAFDLSPETLERTGLGSLTPGAPVNIERALEVGDRLGGHFVAGHVDGIGSVKSIRETGEHWLMHFGVPRELTAMMIPKGSVAVDGISLTIVDLTADSFSVAVIPYTYDNTTLGSKRAGDMVNIETDMLAKMVFKAVGKLPQEGISEGFLREHGFC